MPVAAPLARQPLTAKAPQPTVTLVAVPWAPEHGTAKAPQRSETVVAAPLAQPHGDNMFGPAEMAQMMSSVQALIVVTIVSSVGLEIIIGLIVTRSKGRNI
jgi:hypothetical protein